MKVTVNGRQVDLDWLETSNLEELLVKLAQEGIPEDHLIGSVVVDGEPFSESYPGQSKEIDLKTVREIDVTTVSSVQFASAAAKDSGVFIDRLIRGTNKTAELFRMADEAEANTHFVTLIDAIREFVRFIDEMKNILQWNFHVSLYQGEPVQKEWDRLVGLIDELTEVHEERDWILIADLLEYELAPSFTKWGEIIAIKGSEGQSGN